MKKLLSLVFIALILFISCQVENDDIPESLENAELKLSVSENQDISSHRFILPIEPAVLRRNMQWISFLTLEAIMESPEAKNDFANRIGFQDHILLNDLLGPNIPDDSSFKQKFIELLLEYIDYVSPAAPCNPGSPGEAPQPPVGNLGDTPGIIDNTTNIDRNPSSNSSILNIFDHILNFECIEIFLPYERVNPFADIHQGIAIAHHLQDDNLFAMSAFIRSDEDIYEICGGGTSPSLGFFFNSNYEPIFDLQRNIVLMVRPKRIISSRDCHYLDYPNIDFTTFLN